MAGATDAAQDGASTRDLPELLPASVFSQSFTKEVIASMGPKTTPRVRQVMTSLIMHLHEFAREINLTQEEWVAGVNLLNMAGKISDAKRNEGVLVCGLLGLESLVDEIAQELAIHKMNKETSTGTRDESTAPTSAAILGPFWRPDAPVYLNGSSVILTPPDPPGEVAYLYGQVLDATNGKPLANAEVDMWQANTNGYYDHQDEAQVDWNLRGRFMTDGQGSYGLYCLRPTRYPIPTDGAAGAILRALDKHPFRPAHIHFIVRKEGYKSLTTQIFDRRDEYYKMDTVYAVKGNLIVDFQERSGDDKASLELKYDIRLVPESSC